MRNLLILLVIAVASYQLYTRYQSSAASAYDEYGNAKTLLFTMNGCSPCDDARELLTTRGVEFEEFNVSNGELQASKMKSYGGGRSFPYMVSGNQTLSG
ncbi:MAG: glutaredoxin family protein, partial [Gammaproteobacteria bacterium]|nr:glutaredoxin family protein [Gammaproteobacteria bacterium]